MSWPKEPPGAEPWHLVIVERDGDRYDCRIIHPGCPLLVTEAGRVTPAGVSHRCDVQVAVENDGWETIFSDEPDDPTGVWLVTLTHDKLANDQDVIDYLPTWHWRMVIVDDRPTTGWRPL